MSTPKPNRKRIPPATRRRALELFASCRDGCTEALMLAHGFSIEQLATAKAERVVAAGRTIEVARVRITEARRRALICGNDP